MKGLLMKDIYLMTSQRRFFLFILAFAVVIMFLTGSATFAIGYTTFLGGLFALTTVNYDELENDLSFYFTNQPQGIRTGEIHLWHCRGCGMLSFFYPSRTCRQWVA